VLPPSACTPAPYRKKRNWKKVLDFIATTANISVINILLVLNLKYNSYWEKKPKKRSTSDTEKQEVLCC